MLTSRTIRGVSFSSVRSSDGNGQRPAHASGLVAESALVKIKVLAGGCADLDEREVIILVLPRAPVVG